MVMLLQMDDGIGLLNLVVNAFEIELLCNKVEKTLWEISVTLLWLTE